MREGHVKLVNHFLRVVHLNRISPKYRLILVDLNLRYFIPRLLETLNKHTLNH